MRTLEPRHAVTSAGIIAHAKVRGKNSQQLLFRTMTPKDPISKRPPTSWLLGRSTRP